MRRGSIAALMMLAACHRLTLPEARAGDLAITSIFSPVPIVPLGRPDQADMAVYLTIDNTGDVADTLLTVTSPLAVHAMLHGASAGGGMEAMDRLTLPAHAVTRFAPGGMHLMFEGLTDTVAVGHDVPVTLIFARAGRVTIQSLVLTYAQVDAIRARGSGPNAP
ncbi:MAG: copper chaperone PCu(A)C [Gemmatimonadales bacterium]